MNYKEFREERLKKRLLETNLSRIFQHTEEKNVGIISAFKNWEGLRKKRKKEGVHPNDIISEVNTKNMNRHIELRNLIRSKGYNYIVLVGYWYITLDDGKNQKVKELSFFVSTETERKDELLEDLKKWGDIFNQEAIVFKPYDEKEAYLYTTAVIDTDTGLAYNQKEEVKVGDFFSIGSFSSTKVNDIYSMTKGGKKFAFAEVRSEQTFMGALREKALKRKEELKKVVKESEKFEGGFWVKGNDIYDLNGRTHIDFIFLKPEKFNYTRDMLADTYKKYGERLGQEGKAREEIIRDVSKYGFIRVRKYRNYTSIQFDEYLRRRKVINNFILWAVSENVISENEIIVLIGYDDNFNKKGDVKSIISENKKLIENNIIDFKVIKI